MSQQVEHSEDCPRCGHEATVEVTFAFSRGYPDSREDPGQPDMYEDGTPGKCSECGASDWSETESEALCESAEQYLENE